MKRKSLINLLIMKLLIAVALIAAAPQEAAAKCRNAYSATYGVAGSARICWTRAKLGYNATVKGTVKDLRADKHRATLYVGYYTPGNKFIHSDRIATAPHKGATRYGSWSRGRVLNVQIWACTVDRFGVRYRCGKVS